LISVYRFIHIFKKTIEIKSANCNFVQIYCNSRFKREGFIASVDRGRKNSDSLRECFKIAEASENIFPNPLDFRTKRHGFCRKAEKLS